MYSPFQVVAHNHSNALGSALLLLMIGIEDAMITAGHTMGGS